MTAGEFILAVTVASLYFYLLAAIGYFAGTLVQLNKAFIILLPGMFFGSSIIFGAVIINDIISFFLDETSFIMLASKILGVVLVLFISAALLSDRLEVRA